MESIARLIRALPENYEAECVNQGAVQRWRGVTNAADLMMLCLYHLMNGTSLLEISVIAKLSKLGELSDVAFMKRLAKCKDWFASLSRQLINKVVVGYDKPSWLSDYTVVACDASDVVEKGKSRRIFRLHYMLDIFNMTCADFKITDNKTGETLANYGMKPKMLVLADRIYSTVNGMKHCLQNGADFILRMRKNSFKTVDSNSENVNLLDLFEQLGTEEIADIHAFAKNKDGVTLPVRICAVRKTEEQIKKSWSKMRLRETRRKFQYSDEAKLFNNYIVVVSSLDDSVTSRQIMETYRLRWQVEICFKRLKSILDFGELPKKTDASTMAWLNGKLMVALLIECVIATSFSPNEKFAESDDEERLS